MRGWALQAVRMLAGLLPRRCSTTPRLTHATGTRSASVPAAGGVCRPPLDLPSLDVMQRVLALRTEQLRAGVSPAHLIATPAMLHRHGLTRWDGLLLGVVCVPSPILIVSR